ncbi:MAG: CDP-glycerol glycerophosphotransferase family protein [Eubacterium sp.]
MNEVFPEIKISVIVPVFNIEKYIERCILSLVNQTLQEIEILCIDDGSTDKSAEILDLLQKTYPDKIKVMHIENGGVSNARNIGLQSAHGEYIGFVDGDDYVRSDMYEKLYKKAIDEQSDIVSSAYVSLFEKSSYVKHSGNMQYYGKSLYETPELLTYDVSFLWNKIFKRSMIEAHRLRFDALRIFEDMLFVDKAFLVANRISKCNEPFYYYRRVRPGSAMNIFSEKLFDLFKALDFLFDFYRENNAFETFKETLLFITLNHIFLRYKTIVPYEEIYINLKLKFLDESIEFLNTRFPNWQESDYYYTTLNVCKESYISKEYWTEYIKYVAISNLPEELELIANEIKLRGTLNSTDVKTEQNETDINKKEKKTNKLSDLELGIIYKKYCKKKKINAKSILLDSQHGDNLNGSMFYLLKQLLTDSKYSDFTVYLVYRSEKQNTFLEKLNYYNLHPNLIEISTKDYVKALATSKYLFNDTSFPIFFSKRIDQVYLNTWHGTALKTLGISSKGEIYRIGNLQRNFCSADYVLCPNEHMKNVFDNDYYLSTLGKTKYLFSGYPRNSVFFEKPNQNIIDENELKGKQVILYMPTWRGSVEKVGDNKLCNYLFEIDKSLNDNQIMYVNLHPYVEDLIDYKEFSHIKTVPSKYEIYDFLNCCDILITDYSSVFFDFAVSGKSIIFFTYDLEEYISDRGMYFSLSDFPFKSVNTVEDLISAINDENNVDAKEFVERFCAFEHAEVPQEILDFILFKKDFKGNAFIEEQKHKEKKNVLVYAGCLYNNLHTDSLYKALNNVKSDNDYIITFLSRHLRRNYSVLKGFTSDVKSYSVLGALNYLKSSKDEKLAKAFNNFKYFNRHKNKFMSYSEEEYTRLYGHINIDTIVCYGGKSSMLLSILSCAPCKKILFIPSKGTFNENLNHNIYNNFDKIYYKHKSVGKKLKHAGHKNIEKITDCKQVFTDI